jgi:hypothetical protein
MSTRRKVLKQLAAGGALGAAGLSGLIQQALASGVKPVPPGFQRIDGEVRINGAPARVGQLVKAGDQVRTARGAQAIYVMGSDAFLQRENSVVEFGNDAIKGFFRVVTGRLLSVFGQGQKTLVTPTATIGIRGTACYIEGEAEKTYFCLCYGTADVIPDRDPTHRESITTQYHDHPVYLHHDSAMPMMVNAKVINHTDQELILLENLCGRWPPFYGKTSIYGYGGRY